MMNREQLIEKAKRHRDSYNWAGTKSNDLSGMECEWAADFALSVSTGGWTPVEDSLPDYEGTFWVTYADGSVHIGFLRPDKTGFRNGKVIAWQPYQETPPPYKPKD